MNCDHSGCDCADATIERNGRHFCSQECATGAAVASASTAGCGCGHAGCGRHGQKASGTFRASSAPAPGASAPGRGGAAVQASGSEARVGSRADSTDRGRGSQADRDDQRARGMQAPARGDGEKPR